jgi:hypothetical protein
MIVLCIKKLPNPDAKSGFIRGVSEGRITISGYAGGTFGIL